MRRSSTSEDGRLQGLFARYVEHHVEHGEGLSTEELCAGDPELYEPLHQLVREYHRLDRSLAPAHPLEVGDEIAGYRISARLGAGGMGEVYKADDLKLGRPVAIKVLYPDMAANRERLRRFEQEARAASALNHPNIVTIYDIDRHDGAPFIAMEYVEGRTLAEVLDAGLLSVEEALGLAVQIADGLARAHERGIVHRDVKPENLMVTPDGLVKILDFGLAKLTESSVWPDESGSASDHPVTAEGRILGTAPYMSPEQAQGLDVDARSDVFSFGSVLYEMVTGRRPFVGDSSIQLLAAIVEREPEGVSDLRPSIPDELERLIHRALQKDPARRFQSSAALKVRLQEIREKLAWGELAPSEGAGRRSRRNRRRTRRAWVIGSLVAVALVLGAWGIHSLTRPPRPSPRVVPLTKLEGVESWPALSPDGNHVAYTWDGGESGTYQLYVRLVDVGEPLQLTDGDAHVISPAWSPDGTRIAFFRGQWGDYEVVEIPALGGTERILGRSIARWGGVSWSPDGTHVAILDKAEPFAPDAVFLLSTNTGEKRQLTAPPERIYSENGDRHPVFSPDGRSIAFIRREFGLGINSELYQVSVSTGGETRLTSDRAAITGFDWSPKGESIVFASAREGLRALWKISRRGGRPVRLPVGNMAWDVSTGRSGHRLVYSEWVDVMNIWRAEGPSIEKPQAPAALIRSSGTYIDPEYSPDGSRIVLARTHQGPDAQREIWTCAADGSDCRRLVLGFNPSWSPDGKSVVYVASFPEGKAEIHTVGLDGDFPRRLTEGPEDYLPSWSRDGEWIYFLSRRSGEPAIWKITPEGEQLQEVASGAGPSVESRDGRYLYFPVRRESRRRDIFRIPTAGGEPTLALDRRPDLMNWDVWGGGIFYINPDGKPGPTLEVMDPESQEVTVLQVLGPNARSSRGLSVSPDGRWIVYCQRDVYDSDLMLVEDLELD